MVEELPRTPCVHLPEISDFADGQAADAAQVEQHLADCPECRDFLAFLTRLRTELSPAGVPPAPAFARLAGALPVPKPAAGPPRWAWPSLELAPAALLALALVAAVLCVPRLLPLDKLEAARSAPGAEASI